jgi:hypothetical protein
MTLLKFAGYCGMAGVPQECETRAEARRAAAAWLRAARSDEFPVVTLARGEEWEIQEPDWAEMVPDECGILYIEHRTWECRECGSACETQEAAWGCCRECE